MTRTRAETLELYRKALVAQEVLRSFGIEVPVELVPVGVQEDGELEERVHVELTTQFQVELMRMLAMLLEAGRNQRGFTPSGEPN